MISKVEFLDSFRRSNIFFLIFQTSWSLQHKIKKFIYALFMDLYQIRKVVSEIFFLEN